MYKIDVEIRPANCRVRPLVKDEEGERKKEDGRRTRRVSSKCVTGCVCVSTPNYWELTSKKWRKTKSKNKMGCPAGSPFFVGYTRWTCPSPPCSFSSLSFVDMNMHAQQSKLFSVWKTICFLPVYIFFLLLQVCWWSVRTGHLTFFSSNVEFHGKTVWRYPPKFRRSQIIF